MAVKTIALVTSGAQTLPNFRASLIRRLVAREARVLAMAPDYDDRLRERVRALGAEPVDISLARAGLSPGRDLADMIRLYRQWRRMRPDAVLNYFAKPVIWGSIAARMAGVPRRIAMIEGLGYAFADEETSWRRRLLRGVVERLYRFALRGADRVVFLNEDDRRLFVERRLVPAARALNIGGIGVPLEDFPCTPPVSDPVTFVLAARMIREKGVAEFVAAARDVKTTHPDARFLLLGGPDANPASFRREDLEGWAAEGVVEWPGHVEDVRPYIASSSVFVLPSSYREGVPRSIQEAMAMGKPIITTDQVGCRDTVEEGVNGFLVPMRDPGALAGAMRRVLDDRASIATMGRASRTMAEARFDSARTDAVLIELLDGDVGRVGGLPIAQLS